MDAIEGKDHVLSSVTKGISALCHHLKVRVPDLRAIRAEAELAMGPYPEGDESDEEYDRRHDTWRKSLKAHSDRMGISVDALEALSDAVKVADSALALNAEGKIGESIIYGVWAAEYAAMASVLIHGGTQALREFSRKGAAEAHKEDRSAKADAIRHYIANRESFASLDDAAERMAGKVVPYKFRTVRNWLKGQEPPPRNAKSKSSK